MALNAPFRYQIIVFPLAIIHDPTPLLLLLLQCQRKEKCGLLCGYIIERRVKKYTTPRHPSKYRIDELLDSSDGTGVVVSRKGTESVRSSVHARSLKIFPTLLLLVVADALRRELAPWRPALFPLFAISHPRRINLKLRVYLV